MNLETPPLPNKKYQIIYADPPWKFGGRSYDNPGQRKPIEEYYPTMSDQQLKELRIDRIADKNCILFLWVVNSHLKDCIAVGESWGFRYITVGFVWHKRRALLGNYTMPGCELCLILKRKGGKIPEDKIKGKGNGIKQFYEEFSTEHSKKPDEIRNRIARLFPMSAKIELFARGHYDGWDVWGNEVS